MEEIGQIQSIDIEHQMRGAYLDYAMSVITARALPDARDGLKPVHRRILYAMHDMGIHASSAYKKSARIVGEVLGKYHPHGDMAVYDAMARMAQDFSLRYLLVDGQGNFGSVDGDAPAAMRYTEARLTRMAGDLLADLEKETVNFADNFDGTLKEPEVLPALLPNFLLNGSTGIAVGMATNVPPHNLRELAAAISYLIDNYDNADEIGLDELMQFVKGPDFPTGGLIVGTAGIHAAYGEGRGRIVVRGVAHVEDMANHRQRIVITELPYQVNKATLIERIAELAREGRLDAISDLRDESDRRGMSVVIELKRNAQPKKVLNQLYKYTALQSTFGVQLMALVEGEPKLLRLKPALQIFIEHRRVVITRRSEFELRKARARAHILEGLLIALANLDAVIRTIRESPDAEAAKTNLIERFKLSDLQAQAILDMQLRRLAALERQKIEDEHKEVLATVAYLEDLLASPRKILAIIQTELNTMVEKYGDDRRTQIAVEAKEELAEEDLVENKPVLVSITQRGYIKRTPQEKYRAQSRGSVGAKGAELREEDAVQYLFMAHSLDTILFFSDKGKVYSERAYQIPEADRAERGIALAQIIMAAPGENITAAVAVPDFNAADYCTMVTRKGKIKRVVLSEFAQVRPSGLIATNLDESDFVTSMEVVDPEADLLVVSEKGYGKRTPLSEYATKSRAIAGVATIAQKNLEVTGRVASARVVGEQDEITIITTNGQTLRLRVADIRQSGRSTMGTHLINLKDGDTVASVARLAATDLVDTAPEEKKTGTEAAPTEAAPEAEPAANHEAEASPEEVVG